MPAFNPNIELQNVVYVNSIDDLPQPVGNVITLEDQTLYEFAPGLIDLGANVLVCPQFCSLRGQGTFVTTILSSVTGGDTFITSTTSGGVLHIEGMQFNFSDPNFTLFALENLEQVLVTSSFFIGEGAIGRIANVNTTRFGALCSLVGFSVGLELDGTLGSTFFDRVGFVNIGSSPASKYVYTLPTTTIGIWMSFAGCRLIIPSGTIGIEIDPATTFALGYHKLEIVGCSFDFGGTAVAGIMPDNSNMFARANFGLQDSRAYASYYVDTPSATNFVSAGVAVKANGQTTSGGERGFTQNDNQITYDVPTPIQLHITANAYIIPALVTTTSATLYIAKNGMVITPGTQVYLPPTGAFASVTKVVEANATDYFEIWLANETDTDQITLDQNGTELIAIAL